MFQYVVFEEMATTPELGTFRTFGIDVYQDGRLLFVQHDVFAGEDLVREIARLCTEEQVEPVHLSDIISDML